MTRRKEDDYDPVEIDPYRLDLEWQVQAKLMRQAIRKLANAKRDERDAKAKLKAVEAELILAVREAPERYGLTSGKAPNKEVVEATVILQKEYRRAQHDLHDAEYNVDLLQGDVAALSNKKAGLENSVQLYLSGYYAEPKEPRLDGPAREKAREITQGDRWQGRTKEVTDD